MITHGWTRMQLQQALDEINKKYKGNICFGNSHQRETPPFPKGKGFTFMLRVRDLNGPGAKRGFGTRKKSAYASWYAHYDFMVTLFAIIPDGRIKTALADYNGFAEFWEKFDATGNHVTARSFCTDGTVIEHKLREGFVDPDES